MQTRSLPVYSFGKEYKLCSEKLISSLFKEGKTIRVFPYVVYYRLVPLETKQRFQLVFSAPKRSFKRAHDRNRIKRLMREAFRHKKLILEEELNKQNIQIALFVIYSNKEELPYSDFLARTEKLMLKIKDEISIEK